LKLVGSRSTLTLALTDEASHFLCGHPGHLIYFENAVGLVLACCRGYRLPESIRQAHQLSFGGSLPQQINWRPSDCSGRVPACQKGKVNETKN
jgi:hypothetical protein